MTVNSQHVANMIRFHRKKAGLSQVELAELAGLGKTVIFDVEHGKDTVRWNTLLRIFEVLNIKTSFESPLMSAFKESENEKS